MIKQRPEWVIYKNGQRLGTAVTWHKALANLIDMEPLNQIRLFRYSPSFFVIEDILGTANITYKIIKERG